MMGSSPSPQSIAAVLGGTVKGDTVFLPTPGHSKRDRGTTITADANAPDGCLVHSFNGGDPLAIKDQLREAGQYTPLHADGDLFEKQLAVALGSRSRAVITTFMSDLRKLCGTAWDADLKRWKADETELNAALGMVADWQPENTAQAGSARARGTQAHQSTATRLPRSAAVV